MRLAGIRYSIGVPYPERAPWGRLPYHFPRRCSGKLRDMGKFVVRLQSRGYGMVSTPMRSCAGRVSQCHDSIWYGVQASLGGSCVLVMLRAIWPSIENIRMCTSRGHIKLTDNSHSKPPARGLRDDYSRLRVFLHLLADLTSCNLDASP